MFYAQDLSEGVTALDIFNATKQVIYSVPVSQIDIGDILQITATFEATNSYAYNAMIGSNMILADSATAVLGTLIDPANAFNISPAMHHGVVVKARNWQSQYNYTNKFVNVVAWSGSVNAVSGQMLNIEQSYGHLDVFINKEE